MILDPETGEMIPAGSDGEEEVGRVLGGTKVGHCKALENLSTMASTEVTQCSACVRAEGMIVAMEEGASSPPTSP